MLYEVITNSFRDNFGTIDNTGFEIAVNYTILDKTDWKWDASVNLSHNKNNVVDIDGKSNEIFLASEADQGMYGITGGNKFIVRKGESMGSFYGLESDGLWQVGQEAEAAKYNSKVGEIKYLDKNNDGAITAEDVITSYSIHYTKLYEFRRKPFRVSTRIIMIVYDFVNPSFL